MKRIGMKRKMWRFCLLWMVGVALCYGCKDDDLYNAEYAEEIKAKLFDFNLRTDVDVDIDFGISDYHALVMLYDEYPLDENGNLKGLFPFFSSYTDENCRLQATVEIPSAIKTVYVYSPTYWIPRLTEAAVENGRIVLEAAGNVVKSARSTERMTRVVDNPSIIATINSGRQIYALMDWNWCGEIEDKNGLFLANSNKGLTKKQLTDLQSFLYQKYENKIEAWEHGVDNSYLLTGTDHVNTTIAEAYVNGSGETVMTESAEIYFTFVNERAGQQNAMGYYYYPTEACPTSPDAKTLKKFVIIPNASTSTDTDPKYYKDYYGWSEVSPIENNTTIQLLFEKEDGTFTGQFPAGYTIGYFMVADGFRPDKNCMKYGNNYYFGEEWGFEYKGSLSVDKSKMLYSNAEWNDVSSNGKRERFISVSLEDGSIIYGIEDGGDKSYEDVLFMISANPNEAIQDPDRPVIDPSEEITVVPFGFGIYAFEDIWSSGGDYDMNDVIVKYERKYTIDLKNHISKIAETYTPVHNGATFHDGFGFQLPKNIANVVESLTINGETASFEAGQDLATIFLFDDIQQEKGESYTVELMLKKENGLSPESVKNSEYNPFIVVPELKQGNLRLEVHLPKYNVTKLGWPGAGENWNLWFVGRFKGQGDLQFPFAVDIPYPNFKPAVETVLITEAYPQFKGWDETMGTSNGDWYKNPVGDKVQEYNWTSK